ncbi:hypothetical protein [Halotalea alkalilenta]|uniref:Uncharacterized protein n=1 Tax=Halotalea alkalilenta TaxID=376489 RepID=A0A172YBU8_9GAMM|nr:hypothetical protein [Halotalea alkalilenta]ANF56596.1 hypothetical protein A5892_03185 [Halotalea alkalilenta]
MGAVRLRYAWTAVAVLVVALPPLLAMSTLDGYPLLFACALLHAVGLGIAAEGPTKRPLLLGTLVTVLNLVALVWVGDVSFIHALAERSAPA